MNDLGFRKLRDLIISALDVNVGADFFYDFQRNLVFKNHDAGSTFQSSKDSGSVVFRINRAVGSFAEHSHGFVAVDCDNQASTQRSGLCQVSHMTAMQDVKDTVGQDDRMRELSYEFFELFEGNNLFLERGRRKMLTHSSLAAARRSLVCK